ncbi:hypothetical protein ALC53_04112 [Atta colombica]|uniref:Uncharacterized protein n=1 Tax=Atta colombica TaxID=520822 RepID=A0A195BL68_9HYME|nr:hypothetical protein ALC53_04112 [Atta colombica]
MKSKNQIASIQKEDVRTGYFPSNDFRSAEGSLAFLYYLWKGRLYPAYSLSGSEGEDNTSSLRSRAYPQNNPTNQSHHNHYNTSQHKQRAYQQQQQHPLYHMPGSGAGLSDTPTSGNASDETLTDSDLITVARDSALLVHNARALTRRQTNLGRVVSRAPAGFNKRERSTDSQIRSSLFASGARGAGETEIQNGRFQEEKDINAADYNAPRDATKIVPGKTPRSQSAFITPAESSIYIPRENAAGMERRGEKDADAICKTPVGKRRAMVIEEVEEGERWWQKSKSREGKFRYCLRQPRGTQRL